MNKIIQTSNETLHQTQTVKPEALELISSLGSSLQFSIETINDEQCVVAQVSDLTPEIKTTFEGAGESDEPLITSDWKSLRTEIARLGGAGDTEVQAVRTGETGRQKTIRVGFFGLQNGEELMEVVTALNTKRKGEGVVAEEGLPESIAYVPENILIATREMRQNTVEEIQSVKEAGLAAHSAGALATGSAVGLHN